MTDRLLRVSVTGTGALLASRAVLADSFAARFRGLLGRPPLAQGEGLLLEPCSCVHTWFMRFPIDVCFLDALGRVLGTAPDLKPWRMAGARGADRTLELPTGTLAKTGVREGDLLEIHPCA